MGFFIFYGMKHHGADGHHSWFIIRRFQVQFSARRLAIVTEVLVVFQVNGGIVPKNRPQLLPCTSFPRISRECSFQKNLFTWRFKFEKLCLNL
jgi:hypothetical protein